MKNKIKITSWIAVMVILAVLKLFGVVSFSWFWVFTPLWIIVTILFFSFIGVIIYAEKKYGYMRK